jgi:thioester reductase-like protein/acyl carrier protein
LKVILSIESGVKSQKSQPGQSKQISLPTQVSSIPVTSRVTKEVKSSMFPEALYIIAEESGLAVGDLSDDTNFGDVGVDSLLGLTISARFKEELNIDLDFNALFYDHPTVGDLKVALSESASTTGQSTPSWDTSNPPTATITGRTTPNTDDHSSRSEKDFHRALQVISEESGLALDELTDDTSFADAGVDSLLSLVVVSRLRDELKLDIQHESLFLECPTVADLRHLLAGGRDVDRSESDLLTKLTEQSLGATEQVSKVNGELQRTHREYAELKARETAVETYVDMYTVGFTCPAPSHSSTLPSKEEKVVLVTGGTGSLGGHLVYHLAQLHDVKTVVCLNREHKSESFDRQQKAMRSKGIRFPEALKSKLLVLQADSSKSLLGLGRDEYDSLLGSVTHLIHNAWPMSAKRPLSGFESQFRVFRNLLDFACGVAARRPESFKFNFEMVSSIGVVGRYGLDNPQQVTKVPEDRVDIDSVLPNGYGEAKWGCELMLDRTLHKFPTRFRTMAVRLGQIAGSKTSGYWNPMEHFGFVVKSSQTLGALPDVSGKAYWTPVNDVAAALSDIVLSEKTPYPIYHVENPVGQQWSELNIVLANALEISDLIPFEEWVERVKNAPQHNNPASTLLEFLDSNYMRMSCGGLVLDVTRALEHSKSLKAVKEVSEDVVRKYVHVWREIGFLK